MRAVWYTRGDQKRGPCGLNVGLSRAVIRVYIDTNTVSDFAQTLCGMELNQRSWINLKSVRKSENVFCGHVSGLAVAELNILDVVDIDDGFFGELLLAKSGGQASQL